MKPTVSVIIPVYNSCAFVADAVCSVYAQTADVAIECILVNDGSTDEFEARIQPLRSRYPDLIVISQENQGLAAARNAGCARATGAFVQFLDADDVLLPDKWTQQLSCFAQDPETSVVLCGFTYHFIRENRFQAPETILPDNDSILMDLLFAWERGFTIPIHTALIRRAVLPAPPFISALKAKEDWALWIQLALGGVRFRYIDSVLVEYRIHENNMCWDTDHALHNMIRASLSLVLQLPAEYRDDFLEKQAQFLADRSVSIEKHLQYKREQTAAALRLMAVAGKPVVFCGTAASIARLWEKFRAEIARIPSKSILGAAGQASPSGGPPVSNAASFSFPADRLYAVVSMDNDREPAALLVNRGVSGDRIFHLSI